MSSFMETQSAADRAQGKLDEAIELGLSAAAVEELTAKRDRAKEALDGWAEQYGRRVVAERNDRSRKRREKREQVGVVSEEEFERDMQYESSPVRRAARRRYYRRQDPDTYRPMNSALKGGCLVISTKPVNGSVAEQPPKWFRALMPRRSRAKRRKTRVGHRGRASKGRSSRSSRGSPDDDPHPAEPELGLGALLQSGVPLYLLVLPAEQERDDG